MSNWQLLALSCALLLIGGAGGYIAAWRRSEARAMDNETMAARADAWRLADFRTDLDMVGPVSPPHGTVPALFDQDDERLDGEGVTS